jgi:hypothetical protein
MKKLFGILAAVAIVGSVVMTSCSKYEEGPSLSLRSKKARLAGEWSVSNVTLNGTDVTSLFLPSGTTYSMTIEKDGTWTSSYASSGFSSTEAGTWEFVDSKENLKIVTTGSSDTDGDTSTIVMLKNKELKLKDVSGSDVTIMTLTQD